jgi:hypothetical protein
VKNLVKFLYFFEIENENNSVLMELLEISLMFNIKNLEYFCYSHLQMDLKTIYWITETSFEKKFGNVKTTTNSQRLFMGNLCEFLFQ